GNGAEGTLTLTPNPLNFPDTVVGLPSAAQAVIFTNNSNLPVNFTINGLGGTADFPGVVNPNSCGRAITSLAPGNSCQIAFTFTPTGPGPRSATFTITSNGTARPHALPITGNGAQGTLTLTPDPLNFPDTVVGRQSPAVQTVTVANNSNVPVTIS